MSEPQGSPDQQTDTIRPTSAEGENVSDAVRTAADGDTGPRQLLVTWANEQDSWVRACVRMVLSEGGSSLPPSAIDELYRHLLIEKRLLPEKFVAEPALVDSGTGGLSEPTLVLHRLHDLKGVNALAEGQSLEFDDQLTILWGQNGSGKTGYARVIKRAAAVRTHEEVLGNAFGVPPAPTPSATFEYSLDGERVSVPWANELGHGPLRRVSVFDAKAVNLHVDGDLNYVYTPAELALFSQVNDVLEAVQAKMNAESEALRRTRPDLSVFHRGTHVYAVMESLGAATDVEELKELASLDESADAKLADLRVEVAALQSNALDEQLQGMRRVVDDLRTLKDALDRVANFDVDAYQAALAAERSVEQEISRQRADLLTADELPGPADEQWQEFARAADQYRRHLGLDEYPHAEDLCLYCRQPLGPDAVSLLLKYQAFFDRTTQRQLAEARSTTDAVALKLDADTVARVIRIVEGVATSAPWSAGVLQLLADVRGVVTAISQRADVADRTVAGRALSLTTSVAASLERVSTRVKELGGQTGDRAKVLAEKRDALSDLEDRMELQRRLEPTLAVVQGAKRAEKLRQLSGDVSSRVRRSLTATSKLASEDLANRNFEQLFVEECKALNAPMVGLTFQGRSGQAERKKAVLQHRPSAILSEGEQKVLALADFLAEARMSGTTAPIVFDDPVTSLDYRRLDEVAKRLCMLAEKHQVIVLTHNVMFASALLSHRQTKRQRVKCVEVRESENLKGFLSPDVEPRLDKPEVIAKRVVAAIGHARRAEPATQDALIAYAYDLMRSWCEAFTEQQLLANVTQRYRANVMMTGLSKIRADRLAAATEVIAPMFEKVCRYITGHSNPLEQSNVAPTVADLERDWQTLQDAAAAYLSD